MGTRLLGGSTAHCGCFSVEDNTSLGSWELRNGGVGWVHGEGGVDSCVFLMRGGFVSGAAPTTANARDGARNVVGISWGRHVSQRALTAWSTKPKLCFVLDGSRAGDSLFVCGVIEGRERETVSNCFGGRRVGVGETANWLRRS
jgi:hypothetical protein